MKNSTDRIVAIDKRNALIRNGILIDRSIKAIVGLDRIIVWNTHIRRLTILNDRCLVND